MIEIDNRIEVASDIKSFHYTNSLHKDVYSSPTP